MQPVIVSPSILSADFGRLADEVRAVDEAGADWIHVDVMDGRFVPNITIGPVVVEAVRKATAKPVDVHLMIVEPDRYLEDFAQAGADHLIVHCEPSSTIHLHRTLARIRDLGKTAGVVLNPASPLSAIEYVIELCGVVLIMTVNPGFGGQQFLPEMLPKIRAPARDVQRARLASGDRGGRRRDRADGRAGSNSLGYRHRGGHCDLRSSKLQGGHRQHPGQRPGRGTQAMKAVSRQAEALASFRTFPAAGLGTLRQTASSQRWMPPVMPLAFEAIRTLRGRLATRFLALPPPRYNVS